MRQTKLTNTYLKLATLIKRDMETRAKIRAMQDKLLRDSHGLSGRYSCSAIHGDGTVELFIPLAEMMAMFPLAQTKLIQWTREDGSVHTSLRYGPEKAGEIGGCPVLVKHETKWHEVTPAIVQAVAETAVGA
jgi:hypothetical protein